MINRYITYDVLEIKRIYNYILNYCALHLLVPIKYLKKSSMCHKYTQLHPTEL